jgi:preprotein translocase subunit SecE
MFTAKSQTAIAERAESHVAKKRTSPLQFFREVRAEGRKITWPSWRETWITTVMVMIMVVTTAVFFLLVDQLLSHAATLLFSWSAKLGG